MSPIELSTILTAGNTSSRPPGFGGVITSTETHQRNSGSSDSRRSLSLGSLSSNVSTLPVSQMIYSPVSDINQVVTRQLQRTGGTLHSLSSHHLSDGSQEDLPCAQPRQSLATPSIGNLELTSLFSDQHPHPRILKNSILQLLNPFITGSSKFAGMNL